MSRANRIYDADSIYNTGTGGGGSAPNPAQGDNYYSPVSQTFSLGSEEGELVMNNGDTFCCRLSPPNAGLYNAYQFIIANNGNHLSVGGSIDVNLFTCYRASAPARFELVPNSLVTTTILQTSGAGTFRVISPNSWSIPKPYNNLDSLNYMVGVTLTNQSGGGTLRMIKVSGTNFLFKAGAWRRSGDVSNIPPFPITPPQTNDTNDRPQLTTFFAQ